MIGWVANPWRDIDDPEKGIPFSYGGGEYEVRPGINCFPWHLAQHATGKFPAMRLACFNTEQEAQNYLDRIAKEGVSAGEPD